MGKRLYVGNLSWDIDESKLSSIFGEAGNVESAKIVMDKMSGKSRGFGFVEFSSDEEAAKGIELFNDKEVDGRKLTVNEARPMEARR